MLALRFSWVWKATDTEFQHFAVVQKEIPFWLCSGSFLGGWLLRLFKFATQKINAHTARPEYCVPYTRTSIYGISQPCQLWSRDELSCSYLPQMNTKLEVYGQYGLSFNCINWPSGAPCLLRFWGFAVREYRKAEKLA